MHGGSQISGMADSTNTPVYDEQEIVTCTESDQVDQSRALNNTTDQCLRRLTISLVAYIAKRNDHRVTEWETLEKVFMVRG